MLQAPFSILQYVLAHNKIEADDSSMLQIFLPTNNYFVNIGVTK